MLMKEQAQWETEMTRREQEVQAQMTTMQQHMESLLRVVNESTAKAKQPHHDLDIKLVSLSDWSVSHDFQKNYGSSQDL